MREFRLGCVGLGGRGRGMLQWVAEGIEGMIPVAVCDTDPAKFHQPYKNDSGEQPSLESVFPNVRFFEDYDEMLEQAGLDIVMVETPATCHAEFCVKALARGIHVYSDIPSVASLAEADALWKAQNASDAILMTGATTCGWGFLIVLEELFRQGLLGNVVSMDAEYIHDCRCLWERTPWRKPSATKPGRGPITYCTHSLGPLLKLLDEDLTRVVCLSSGSKISGLAGAHDVMTAVYQTPSGILFRNTNSFINCAGYAGHSYRVFGTEGYFEHTFGLGKDPGKTRFRSEKLKAFEKLTELDAGFAPPGLDKWTCDRKAAESGHGGADGYLWHIFAEALRQGGQPAPIDVRAGLRMTLPGIYAAESARLGGVPLEIKYPWSDGWTAAF